MEPSCACLTARITKMQVKNKAYQMFVEQSQWGLLIAGSAKQTFMLHCVSFCVTLSNQFGGPNKIYWCRDRLRVISRSRRCPSRLLFGLQLGADWAWQGNFSCLAVAVRHCCRKYVWLTIFCLTARCFIASTEDRHLFPPPFQRRTLVD
jgi:hypothetical protein